MPLQPVHLWVRSFLLNQPAGLYSLKDFVQIELLAIAWAYEVSYENPALFLEAAQGNRIGKSRDIFHRKSCPFIFTDHRLLLIHKAYHRVDSTVH